MRCLVLRCLSVSREVGKLGSWEVVHLAFRLARLPQFPLPYFPTSKLPNFLNFRRSPVVGRVQPGIHRMARTPPVRTRNFIVDMVTTELRGRPMENERGSGSPWVFLGIGIAACRNRRQLNRGFLDPLAGPVGPGALGLGHRALGLNEGED